jgi:hypothetical protein
MPLIDLNDVLVSMDIACQTFDVIRREEVVGSNGRATITETVISDVVGAVQPLGDNSLLREEAFAAQKNGVEVWTQTRLYAVGRVGTKKYQPDIIRLANGNTYEVKILDGWNEFGRGFSHAHCEAFDYVQTQPEDLD